MSERRKFKLRRYPPVQLLAYVFVRSVIAVVSMFPPRLVRKIGRFLGRALFAIDAKHRRIALKNVSLAEGMPKEPRAVERFVRRVYEHFGMGFVEMLQLPRVLQRGEIARWTKLENFEVFDRVLEQGRGGIVVIAHQGNWEWTGIAVTMAGYPLNSVARPIENPYVDRYLNRFRSITGQRIIPKYNALKAMSEVLRRNELLVILADQDVRHGGVFVPFFGRPASTVRSPALFALRHKAPILPVKIWRDERGIHHARVSEPIVPEAGEPMDAAVRRLTEAFTARFEGFIREHPAQWMWLHARWKTASRTLREEAAGREPSATVASEERAALDA